MAVARASMRASDLCRSRRTMRHAIAASTRTAIASVIVRAINTSTSELRHSPPAFNSRDNASSEGKLHGHFDDHIDRFAETPGRGKLPVSNGAYGAFVESRTEPSQHPDVADGAVVPDDNLQDHVTGHAAPSRLVGVLGLDLVKKPRRIDAAACTERASTRAAARTLPKTRTKPRTGAILVWRLWMPLARNDGHRRDKCPGRQGLRIWRR